MKLKKTRAHRDLKIDNSANLGASVFGRMKQALSAGNKADAIRPKDGDAKAGRKSIFQLRCVHIHLFAFLLAMTLTTLLSAQEEAPGTAQQLLEAIPGAEQTGGGTPKMVTELAVLAGVALLPFAVMLLTSYVKIVIVLSLLRNALGVQQSPPNQVLNGIALLMTIYVMFPTGVAMYRAAGDYIEQEAPKELISSATAVYVVNVIDKAKEPLRTFLQKNTSGKHMTGFYQLAYRTFPEDYRAKLKPNDFLILVPAFITSQLKTAFEIGVLIYLPFFVIDLVTSNILLAMGMMMLSPLTIALPLKLLLLVMVDGWTLIIQGLAMSFRT